MTEVKIIFFHFFFSGILCHFLAVLVAQGAMLPWMIDLWALRRIMSVRGESLGDQCKTKLHVFVVPKSQRIHDRLSNDIAWCEMKNLTYAISHSFSQHLFRDLTSEGFLFCKRNTTYGYKGLVRFTVF